MTSRATPEDESLGGPVVKISRLALGIPQLACKAYLHCPDKEWFRIHFSD
jgi:hypothetical protein